MFLLAVETSSQAASLALMNLATDGAVITVAMASPRQTARWLAQAVHDLLENTSLKPADVGVLAVTHGPGSFTGLRIGVTFAKVFCYATSSRLIAVDTLEVLARQSGYSGTVHAVMDALRGELFHASFSLQQPGDDRGTTRLSDTRLLTSDQLASIVRSPCCVVGSLAPALRRTLPEEVVSATDERAFPQAATVAELARRRVAAGQFDDPWTLQPLYLRMHYAAEKKNVPVRGIE